MDFILRYGDKLVTIEVKSNQELLRHSGIDSFVKQFKPHRTLLVGDHGIPLEEFLSSPMISLF